MRFIRKNGRIIPIQDGGGSSQPKTLSLSISAKKVTAGQRFKEGVGFGAKLTAPFAAIGAGIGSLEAYKHIRKNAAMLRYAVARGHMSKPAAQAAIGVVRKAGAIHIVKSAAKASAPLAAISALTVAAHTAFGPRKRYRLSLRGDK